MALKKLLIKGLIAITAGIGAMITGWGVGSLFDFVDASFEEEKDASKEDEPDKK